jgi:hypothetical protein
MIPFSVVIPNRVFFAVRNPYGLLCCVRKPRIEQPCFFQELNPIKLSS